jgi:hypothetical protein
MLLLTQVIRKAFAFFLAIFSAPERLNPIDGQSSSIGNFHWVLQFIQGAHGGFDYVQNIGTAQTLGENITDARGFNHGTHSAASDHPRARRSRFHKDFGSAIPRSHLVGDGGPCHGDEAHVVSRFLSTLANGIRHLAGFTHSNTHPATVVSNHHNRPEAEAPATFYDLGRARDMNYTLVKLFDFFDLSFPIRHVSSDSAVS